MGKMLVDQQWSVRQSTRIPHNVSSLLFLGQIPPEDVQDCRGSGLERRIHQAHPQFLENNA